MIDFLNSLVTVGAFAISIVYGIGFIIIVFNLSQFGIEEFQIINFKYLFVGFTFIVNHVMFFGISCIFSMSIFRMTNDVANPYFIAFTFFFITLIASMTFIISVAKFSKINKTITTKRSMHSRYFFYAIVSIIGSLYPSYILNLFFFDAMSVKYAVPVFKFTLDSISLDFLRGITVAFWLFFFWSQLGYYARFYYGVPNPLSSVDRTGIGLPNKVQFMFDEAKSKFFSQIGVQIIKPGMTGMIQLLETTNDDYIIYIPPDTDPNTITSSAVKISKDIIVGVIYHQDEALPIEKK